MAKVKVFEINLRFAQILFVLLILFSNQAYADKGILVSEDSYASTYDITLDDETDFGSDKPYINFSHESPELQPTITSYIWSDTTSHLARSLIATPSIRAPPFS